MAIPTKTTLSSTVVKKTTNILDEKLTALAAPVMASPLPELPDTPTFSVSAISTHVAENADFAEFKIELSSSAKNAEFKLKFGNKDPDTGVDADTATGGGIDYGDKDSSKSMLISYDDGVTWGYLNPNKVVIPEKNLSIKVRVAIINDGLPEGDETFTLRVDSNSDEVSNNSASCTVTISDNVIVTPTITITDASEIEGKTLNHTVTLSSASPTATTFAFSLTGVTATSDANGAKNPDFSANPTFTNGVTYDASTGKITVPANITSFTVSYTTVDDNLVEGSETTSLSIGGVTAVGTIGDNDVVSISIDNKSVIEGNNLVHTVTLSNPSSTAATYAFSLKGVTATDNVDFSANPTFTNGVTYDASTGKIIVPANTTSFTVSYTTFDDKDIEPTETTALTIGGVTAVGTITDNDSATTPVVSINSVTVTEGTDKYAVFTLSLDKASKVANTFKLELADVTATGKGIDYGNKLVTNLQVSTNGGTTWTSATSATIEANKTSVLVRTPIIDDKIDENDETFTLTATRTKGDTFNTSATGSATIKDNDATPSLSINDVKVDESAGTMTFTVKLSAASGLPVSVDYLTSDAGTGAGYATAGKDYTPVTTTGKIDFAPNETSKTITIAIIDDKDIEGNETFNVILSNASNATISKGVGIGTIVDNDDKTTASINSVTVTEGADKYAVFTLSLDKATTVDNTFKLALADVTATGKGIDYGSKLAASNIEVLGSDGKWTSATSVTIAANSTNVPPSVQVRTAIIDDKMDENNETFTLTATRTSGNTTNASVVGTATIKDNDDAPSISINDVSRDESAGTMTFTVKLSAASGLPVSVDYSTSDAGKGAGYATEGSDYTPSHNTIKFAPNETSKTITIAIKDDTKIEGDEIFHVNLSNASNATISKKLGVGTIEDNDEEAPADPVTISIADAGMIDEGGILIFEVTLSEASTETITVNYSTKDGDLIHTNKKNIAIAGADYNYDPEITGPQETDPLSGTITFQPGDTVAYIRINTITESGDAPPAELDEYLRVVLSSPSKGVTIANDTGTGGINENDQTQCPLILDLNHDGVQSINITAGVTFDHNVNGKQEHTGWVEKNDGLLAIDLNHDGIINNGREIFGNNTLLADGSKAKDGFEALAQYDSNQDGKIDAQDAIYKDLVVWKDGDSDGNTDAGELSGLSQNGVSSLNLGWTASNTNVEDNRHSQVGSFTDNQGNSHEMTDVWFKVSEGADTFTWSLNDHGQAGAPTINHIENFNVASSGDKLDLRDLLQGETKDTLLSYLHFEKQGADTVMHVSTGGGFDANQQAVGSNFAHDVEDKTIVIQHVDLIGNLQNDHQVIQNLLQHGQLITD